MRRMFQGATHLGLEVAVDDAVLAQEDERLEHLDREPANEGRREADEAVGLDELVQVDAQKLGRDAEVVPEVEVLRHDDDAVLLVGILLGVGRRREGREGQAELAFRSAQRRGERDAPICAGCRGS